MKKKVHSLLKKALKCLYNSLDYNSSQELNRHLLTNYNHLVKPNVNTSDNALKITTS